MTTTPTATPSRPLAKLALEDGTVFTGVFFEPEWGGAGVGGFFPIVPDRCLKLAPTERVVHTRMFSHPDTAARISAWLA